MASGKLRRYSKKIEDRDNPQPSLYRLFKSQDLNISTKIINEEGSTTKWIWGIGDISQKP